MSAIGGGLKGSMQHPPRASNDNANSTLDLYLFKGRNSRHFQSHQSRFHGGCAEPSENVGFHSPGPC